MQNIIEENYKVLIIGVSTIVSLLFSHAMFHNSICSLKYWKHKFLAKVNFVYPPKQDTISQM